MSKSAMPCSCLLSIARVMAATSASRGAEPTVITLNGRPLVKDVSRFGINLGSGSVHAISRIKCMNFEGMQYRQCHIGDLHKDSFKPDAGTFPVNEHDYWRMNVEVVQVSVLPHSLPSRPTKSGDSRRTGGKMVENAPNLGVPVGTLHPLVGDRNSFQRPSQPWSCSELCRLLWHRN